jgi:hypothetical protein
MPNWGGGASEAVKYGAAGARIGSIVPGVGTVIGGGIGAAGGFLKGLFSGGKKKKPKPGEAAAPNSPEAQLQTSADESKQLASSLTAQGQESIAPAQNYFKGLLSSNPQEMLAATAPERGRVIDQYDAARQATAEFGPRGGGSTSAQAAARTQQAAQLGDILSTGKREAASASASLGTTLTGLGMTAKQLQSADLNSVLSAILTREGLDVTKRGQTMQAWSGVGQGVGSILGGYLAGA